jgi:preprotein translocase subunit YajC
MDLQVGDLVQTESGISGRIAFISRLTAFVDIREGDNTNTVPCLLSELSRVDPPHLGPGRPDDNFGSSHS